MGEWQIRRRWRPTVLGACILLAWTGTVESQGVLRRGTSAEAWSLDPAIGAANLAAPIINDLFEGLLGKDAALRPIPGMAERWTVSDDGLIYTFHLREGITWSDGKPVTADDFVYGYRRMVDPATGSPIAGQFFPIVNAREIVTGEAKPETLGVSAPDPRTVVVRLVRRAPWFFQLISTVPVAPVPRHVIEAHGREWTKPEHMVTNGPYTLAARIPQTVTRLRKNPRYWRADEVSTEEVHWYPTQDLATSLRRFRAGELDQILNFPPDEIGWIRKNMPEALKVTPTPGVYYLVINTARKPFDDVRVRRALYLAVDRGGIADKLLATGMKPANSFAGTNFSDYPGIRDADLERPMPERQRLARDLLAEAGFGPARPLSFDYHYDTNEENRKIAVALTAMWQAIGVKVRPVNVDFGQLNRQVRTQSYQVARWVYFASYDDPYAFLTLYGSDNNNNYTGWSSAAYDRLLEASNREADPVRRREILEQAERLLLSEAPVIPIYEYVRRYLVSPRVQGWVTSGRGPTPSRFLSVPASR